MFSFLNSQGIARNISGWALTLGLICMMLTGCDQAKQALKETQEAAQDLAQPTEPVDHDVPESPAPVAPKMETPQEIIDRFLAKAPHERTNDDLTQLANLPEGLDQITELELSQSTVGDYGLTVLSKFPELTLLNLHKTQTSNQGLPELGKLPKLKKIILDHTNVGSAGTAMIAPVPYPTKT